MRSFIVGLAAASSPAAAAFPSTADRWKPPHGTRSPCLADVANGARDAMPSRCRRRPTQLHAWPKRGDGQNNDEYDDDGEDEDDAPPDLSTSPQEFLYRMQQKGEGLDVTSAGRSRDPSNAPRSRPSSSFGNNNRKSSFSRAGVMGRGGKKGVSSSGSKDATVFVCTSCGSESLQWRGRCGSCHEWNTIQEYRAPKTSSGRGLGGGLGGGRPPSFGGGGSGGFQRTGSSWLDGIDGAGDLGGGTGGPVRVTDVYEEILSNADSKDGMAWDEAYSNGSREHRTLVPDDPEMNAVLGGGLMPGSICLVGGDPGVGKSTLLLQMAGSVASMAERSLQYQGIGMGPPKPSAESEGESSQDTVQTQQQRSGGPVLYVSGEENANQIASRALRLGIQDPELLLWCETDADYIVDTVANAVYNDDILDHQDHSKENTGENSPPLSKMPSLVIIDSIQTMLCDAAGASAAGGITQVRECVGLFLRLAKSAGVPVMLVGHVTKSGDVAGPRTVEHMVDSVLYLEGGGLLGAGGGGGSADGGGGISSLRVLRAAKNRFGSSEEVGVYMMGNGGRLVPVSDPSSFFLSTRQDSADAEGCAVSVVLEGIRSMTVEVQALVAWSAGSGGYSGRRIVDGVSNSRLLLILAVLQKRYGISFHRRDVYVNVVGGMQLGKGSGSGGGSDLAVAVAVVSSMLGIPVRSDTAFVGEVGLLGELRPVHSLDKRISEARRMGFSRIVTPSSSSGKKKMMGPGPKEVSVGGIKQIMCDNVLDAINSGLADKLPTRQTRSGPKLIKPKQRSKEGDFQRKEGANTFGMDELDIILDDEDDDVFE